MAEQAIFDALSAIPALGNRVYPLVLPQNAEYPAVVYPASASQAQDIVPMGAMMCSVEATIQVRHLQPSGTSDSRPSGCTTEAVRAHCSVCNSIRCFDMMLEGERDDFEDETNLYRKSYDVRAWYRDRRWLLKYMS